MDAQARWVYHRRHPGRAAGPRRPLGRGDHEHDGAAQLDHDSHDSLAGLLYPGALVWAV